MSHSEWVFSYTSRTFRHREKKQKVNERAAIQKWVLFNTRLLEKHWFHLRTLQAQMLCSNFQKDIYSCLVVNSDTICVKVIMSLLSINARLHLQVSKTNVGEKRFIQSPRLFLKKQRLQVVGSQFFHQCLKESNSKLYSNSQDETLKTRPIWILHGWNEA
jgi:hypothetical protein